MLTSLQCVIGKQLGGKVKIFGIAVLVTLIAPELSANQVMISDLFKHIDPSEPHTLSTAAKFHNTTASSTSIYAINLNAFKNTLCTGGPANLAGNYISFSGSSTFSGDFALDGAALYQALGSSVAGNTQHVSVKFWTNSGTTQGSATQNSNSNGIGICFCFPVDCSASSQCVYSGSPSIVNFTTGGTLCSFPPSPS